MLMKKITQQQIAKKLTRTQSYVSKRLKTNSLKGYEIKLLSEKLNVPASVFYDKEEQPKYLTKLFIQDNNTSNSNNKSIPKV